ncbi:carboxypeptidase-like regulatory domain-containing protein [Flavobacterium sp. PL12]|uniref:carboxypeptidase-like regulatory domain-containing protein n=1 Tax=Flavobacterium sp. PL12 TaxID=3071718 RepID=UPI00319DACCC
MKVKLLVVLFFVVLHSGYSQSEKLISGKITSENFTLQSVDVINKSTEKSTTTNAQGLFSINSKLGDTLIFYKKDYFLKEIKLTTSNFSSSLISVQLNKRAEELDEVIIKKAVAIDWKLDTNYEKIKRDELAADKAERRLKNTRIDDLTIDKGLDIARIGKTLFNLLVKESPTEKVVEVNFKEVALNICEEKFFTQTLKLKPSEIELFLQFCDADTRSQSVLKEVNVLSMMDFLATKNIEFKKL